MKSSCAKCRLSGRRYIGGVVGNGCSARSKDERASTVSACYTLAEILGTIPYEIMTSVPRRIERVIIRKKQ